jgi:hypothetical protein
MTTATLTTATTTLTTASLINEYYDYEARLNTQEEMYWLNWTEWLESNPF